jgi:4-methyl-5(b-hydroxyethyl)-thiazole monophosphate biosynthesis
MKVMLLLPQGFEAYEAAVYTDIFGWNNDEIGDYPIELVTVGLRDKIKCTWNFTVLPEKLLNEVDLNDFNALAIPGGFEEADFYEDAYNEDLLNVIRHFDKKKQPISSVCVGSLPIAKSGVLNGRNGVTYHQSGGARLKQMESFGVNIADELFVVDDNVVTCSGPGNALSAAFQLLETMTSKENVNKVKAAMGF